MKEQNLQTTTSDSGHALLKDAIRSHADGNIDQAINLYNQLLQFPDPPKHVYQNLISCLRTKQKLADGLRVANLGLSRFPNDASILLNQGNILLDLKQYSQAFHSLRLSLSFDPTSLSSLLGMTASLRGLKLPCLAYRSLLSFYLKSNKTDKGRLIPYLLNTALEINALYPDLKSKSESLISSLRRDIDLYKPTSVIGNLRLCALLCETFTILRDTDVAYSYYKKADSLLTESLKNNTTELTGDDIKRWHSASWNNAINLLKVGDMKSGWKLYDHGLVVPTNTPQRWQRCLQPIFSYKDIPIWQGSDIAGKNILIYAEQAIGDTIMFATLLPMIDSRATIYFLPGKRLHGVFSKYSQMPKNIKYVTRDEVRSLGSSHFTYQIPVGSLPKFFIDSYESYTPPQNPILNIPSKLSRKLRKKYLDHSRQKAPLVVGISWQGGGTKDRQQKKSVNLIEILRSLDLEDILFVSLQYGDDASVVSKAASKTGVPVIHDDTMDPITDFIGWLPQVDAVDCVLTVANTTVHAAAMLSKPTFCLVSNQSDWRWIDPSIYKGNYWYKDVYCSYQDPAGDWDSAILDAKIWLKEQRNLLAKDN